MDGEHGARGAHPALHQRRFGVPLETTIVRSVILPALVMDLGDRIWWPGRDLYGDHDQ